MFRVMGSFSAPSFFFSSPLSPASSVLASSFDASAVFSVSEGAAAEPEAEPSEQAARDSAITDAIAAAKKRFFINKCPP